MSTASSGPRVVIELNSRDRRMYDRLRAQVIESIPGEKSGLRDVLLLFPDLAVLLARLIRDPRVPFGGKALAVLGIGYVLSPIELLPEIILGPVGLIDDLLVLAAALSRILNYVHPDVVRSHWSGQGDALDAIQRVTEWSEELVTETVPSAIGRTLGRFSRLLR